ncbi:MAG: hypothetical protein ACOYYS_27855 [Chloroflexota bacterium]
MAFTLYSAPLKFGINDAQFVVTLPPDRYGCTHGLPFATYVDENLLYPVGTYDYKAIIYDQMPLKHKRPSEGGTRTFVLLFYHKYDIAQGPIFDNSARRSWLESRCVLNSVKGMNTILP